MRLSELHATAQRRPTLQTRVRAFIDIDLAHRVAFIGDPRPGVRDLRWLSQSLSENTHHQCEFRTPNSNPTVTSSRKKYSTAEQFLPNMPPTALSALSSKPWTLGWLIDTEYFVELARYLDLYDDPPPTTGCNQWVRGLTMC